MVPNRPARPFIFSSKCDFVLRGEVNRRSDSADAEHTRLDAAVQGMRVGVSADKCDWRVTGQHEDPARFQGELALQKGNWHVHATVPHGRMVAGSSKCDWRLHFDESLPVEVAAAGFQHELRRSVQSDKCDWQVVTGDPLRRIEGSVRGRGVTASLHSPRVEARLSSDKCDWSMSSAVKGLRPPQVEARMASSKCDFALQFQFGNTGGRAFRIRATGSSKCDFRLGRVEVSDDGTTWVQHSDPTPDKIP
jgi:hypothetical protein